MSSTQLKLSQFCALINETLENTFRDKAFWVLAEINSRNDKARSIWFELIEKSASGTDLVAKMTGKVWRTEALAAFRNFEDITGKRPDQGMQVLMKLAVNYHAVHGLSLDMLDIDANHMLGQMEMQRRQTIELLSKKPGIRLVNGKFETPNNSLELPDVITNIAIISSASAAGFEDFNHSLQKNMFGYRFNCMPYFSILQGENASESMKEQLLKIFQDSQNGKTFDAVVIIRGGGAQSDLLPFDNFNLAHTVARFPIPIITGIGHLKNESIVDMVTHSPMKTPTEAAEFIIDHNRSFEEEIENLRDLIVIRSSSLLSRNHLKLEHCGSILTNGTMQLLNATSNQLQRFSQRTTSGAQKLLQSNRNEVETIQRSFTSVSQFFFQRHQHSLDIFTERIKNLHPENVLKRGYAIISKKNEIVVSAKNINENDSLKITMKDGSIDVNVISTRTTT